jgi:hypothetical protein
VEATIAEQTAEAERRETEDEAKVRDVLRLILLDRLTQRCPELGNIGDHEVEWRRLPQGDEALVLDRSGLIVGRGGYFMLDGDVLAVGPIGPDHYGVIAIHPDGSREERIRRPAPDFDDEGGPVS